jgi:multidrug efflux system outer membrane protein
MFVHDASHAHTAGRAAAWRRRLTPCVLVLLAACAPIPDDPGQPDLQSPAALKLANDIHLANEGWPDAQWWQSYHDAQLDGLISRALKSSPSLVIAEQRVAAAQAAYTARQSTQGLGFDFAAQAVRQRYSANGLLPEPIGGSEQTELQLQAQASYAFDWWGKYRSYVQAAAGEINARRAEQAQSQQMLASLVAQNYFALQSRWARERVLEQAEQTLEELVQVAGKRVQHGLANSAELRQWQNTLAQLRQQLAQQHDQATQTREALKALLADDANVVAALKPVELPAIEARLPDNAGLELLARRPDLQAARWRIQSALSQVDYTRAAFYPEINLFAAVGLDSLSLGKLFEGASRTWQLGPGLTLPLFSSKALSGQLAKARSDRNTLIASYNQAVFNAVRDVAQAGSALQSVQARLNQHLDIARRSSRQLGDARREYQAGLIDRQALLQARLDDQASTLEGLQLTNQALQADLVLIASLGGGYHNQAGVPELVSAAN